MPYGNICFAPTPLSRGKTSITTSKDPVDGMLFYRDVPLMATVGEKGRIMPLGTKGIPLIAWRMKDVGRRDSKVVLTGMALAAVAFYLLA